jgi:hypothetical protein
MRPLADAVTKTIAFESMRDAHAPPGRAETRTDVKAESTVD